NVPRSKESDPNFPPGFTPDLANNVIDKGENVTPSTSIKEQVIKSNKGSPPQRSTNMAIVGGSILEVMDDLVKVGQTMGLRHKAKKRWIKELCLKHRINFVTLQETKMESINLFSIKALWGNFTFDHAISSSVGNSRDLWGYIRSMIDRWEGETVILGDFNEVRTEQERFGSIFNVQGANMFNNFISMANLIDLPLGGYSYTWAHKSATKMSKLDRFLVFEGLLALFPYLSGICLDRHLSDHRPILMCESVLVYGPTPFRMYHSWFKIEGFNKFVEDSWNSMNISNPNAMICLKKKFQTLKYAIKSWSKENKKKLNATKAAVQNKLSKLSQKAKVRWAIEGDENSKFFHGIINNKRSQLAIRRTLVDGDWIVDPSMVKYEFLNHFSKQFSNTTKLPKYRLELIKFPTRPSENGGNPDVLNHRSSLLSELQYINSIDVSELSQKAKVQWAIEGDENSKFFHGIINNKRSQLAIRRTLVDGDWIVDPSKVKYEFLNHFSKQFSRPQTPQIRLEFQFPTRLQNEQVEDLERATTYDEIKTAVWDCGNNKTPGPDGFSFKFFRKFWNLIDKDVVAAISEFFDSGKFPPGCNSSFIALIPKIQDAKVVKDYRPISLIGSMYKIIAKILANRLSLVMPDLISDVQSTFVANRQILDGPFILNELLSWCKYKKVNAMIFKVDFKKAFDSVRWDYLDNVLNSFGFGEKWRSWINGCLSSSMDSVLVNGNHTSEFHFHKGLKKGDPLSPFLFNLIMESLHLSFNRVLDAGLHKGIYINNSLMISHLFYADDAVFVVPIGTLHSLESIRRDFFNGIDRSERKMVWIRWDNILASKKHRGLGVSSFYALNRALLFKWLDIVRDISSLDQKWIDLLSFVRKKVGNGENSFFWIDTWSGEVSLKTVFPRLYALELCKDISVADKLRHATLDFSFCREGAEEEQFRGLSSCLIDVILPQIHDRWFWSLDDRWF
ncbi:RNA-directed DNA polymerase, eukaryota, partial [Tanacetum coccineum]